MSHFIHSCFKRNTAGGDRSDIHQRLLPPSPDHTHPDALTAWPPGTEWTSQMEGPAGEPATGVFPTSKKPDTEVSCFFKNFFFLIVGHR